MITLGCESQIDKYRLGEWVLNANVQFSKSQLLWSLVWVAARSDLFDAITLSSLIMQIHGVLAAQPRIRPVVVIMLCVGAFTVAIVGVVWEGLYMKVALDQYGIIVPPDHWLYLRRESLTLHFWALLALFSF